MWTPRFLKGDAPDKDDPLAATKETKLIKELHVTQIPIDEEGEKLINTLREKLLDSNETRSLLDEHGLLKPEESVPPGNPHGYLTNHVIWRFLVARDKNVEKAFKQIYAMLRWRVERLPHQLKASELEWQAKNGKVYSPGLDRHGRPILVLDNTKETMKDVTEQMKFLGWNMERAVRKMQGDVQKLVVFIKLGEFSFFNQPSLKATRETLLVLQTCYAEHLGHLVAFQAPAVFKVFFQTVCKPFLDPKTASKIVIALQGKDGSKEDQLLRDLIGDDWKAKCGADCPVIAEGASPGYNHAKEWASVVEEEAEFLESRARAAGGEGQR